MNNLLPWLYWVKANPTNCNIDAFLIANDIQDLLNITKELQTLSKKLLKKSKDGKLNEETKVILRKLSKWEKYGASNE